MLRAPSLVLAGGRAEPTGDAAPPAFPGAERFGPRPRRWLVTDDPAFAAAPGATGKPQEDGR